MIPDPSQCPVSVFTSFMDYLEKGVPPGDFVRACLENNLSEAFRRADEFNIMALPHIVAWLYNEMPIDKWGDRQRVEQHLKVMQGECL